MIFRIEPNPEETQRACRAIATASLPASRATGIMLGVYAAVIGAAVWLTPSTAPLTILIAVGGILLAALALQADNRARVRRLQAADPHARETHFVELGPNGARTWCAHVETRYTWEGTTRVMETPEFYLFVRNSSIGLAVPKRIVSVTEDRDLRRHVRDWLPAGVIELSETSGESLAQAS